MKMEHTVEATDSGVVKRIVRRAGEQVMAADALLFIETDDNLRIISRREDGQSKLRLHTHLIEIVCRQMVSELTRQNNLGVGHQEEFQTITEGFVEQLFGKDNQIYLLKDLKAINQIARKW